MGRKGAIGLLILAGIASPCALQASEEPRQFRGSVRAHELVADADDRERRRRERKRRTMHREQEREKPLQSKSLPPPKAKPSEPRERTPRSR